jgi:serine/threonine-protein kinase
VSVEIEGAPAPVQDGTVEIEGAPGSIHHVRIFKGKDEYRSEVIVTEAGAFAPKLELGLIRADARAAAGRESAPGTAASTKAKATAPPKPSASADSLFADP